MQYSLIFCDKNIFKFKGKSIDELTDFCKKLSKGGSGYLTNDDEYDVEADTTEKAFNHPFVLKDRGPIVMNIRVSFRLITYINQIKT